ncbi:MULTISPECIES: hypothetical protein [unclassified Streptomyces]|uniref:hypothetical protein n=1 Tax=unclassified Streptomyces TaxID=2593676 RepID=UPI002E294817|nr:MULTISPECIES: hypothetical protein [unclassified Streptomyces]
MNGSGILPSNQIIDALGLREEMDRTIEGIAGPAPKPPPVMSADDRLRRAA